MKKTTALAGLALSIGLIFTGCSNTDESDTNKSTEQSETSQAEASAVSETLNNYYNSLVEHSPEAMEVSTEVESTIREIAGDDTYEAFSSSNNPFTGFDDISDDQAKKLADKLQELNPVADQFDYSQMEDRDRAVLNLLNIASSIMLTSVQGETIQISIPEEAILVEENIASIPYSSMTFIIGESETPMADALGSTDFHAIKVDGEWKVDGLKTYESTKETALGTQPSDAGGSSDSGEG